MHRKIFWLTWSSAGKSKHCFLSDLAQWVSLYERTMLSSTHICVSAPPWHILREKGLQWRVSCTAPSLRVSLQLGANCIPCRYASWLWNCFLPFFVFFFRGGGFIAAKAEWKNNQQTKICQQTTSLVTSHCFIYCIWVALNVATLFEINISCL